MSKRAAVALAVVIGLIAICAPIAIAIYWAWKQSFDEQIEQVTSIAFGTSAESWLNQQAQYDLWHAEQRRKQLRVMKLAA